VLAGRLVWTPSQGGGLLCKRPLRALASDRCAAAPQAVEEMGGWVGVLIHMLVKVSAGSRIAFTKCSNEGLASYWAAA
jgi:DNA mismatch repair protein MutH